jgi:hypothetical protein
MSVNPSAVLVRPVWKIDLKHIATRLTSTPGAQRIAVASEAALVSVAEFGRHSVQTVALNEPASHLAIDPAGGSLAVVGASRKLQLLGLKPHTFGRELARLEEPVYDVCAFSRDGARLWAVAALPDGTAEVRCYDAQSWELTGRMPFKPLIGGCGFWLTLHPQDDLLGLWAIGGPDELWNYWVRMTEAGVELRRQPELDGSTAPAFNTRGDRFAVLNVYDLLTFSFPDCTSLYPPMTLDDDDTLFENICYLDSAGEDRVLGHTNQGRVFVAAPERGELIAEVRLEGHEPRPCYQVYPGLSRTDNHLCGDLYNFTPVGSNLVLSVHTNGRVSDDRKDTLLLWRAPHGE